MRWSGRTVLPSFDEDPADDPWTKWAWGVSLPVIVGLIALWVAVTAHATWPGRGGRWVTVDGLAAEGVALVLFGLAGFWHCHNFWLLSPRMHGFAQLGKLLGVACVVGGVLMTAWLELRPF